MALAASPLAVSLWRGTPVPDYHSSGGTDSIMLVPRIRQSTARATLAAQTAPPISGMWRYALVTSVGLWGLAGSVIVLIR